MLLVFVFETGLISTEPASGSICMETMRVSISLPLDGLGSGNTVAAEHSDGNGGLLVCMKIDVRHGNTIHVHEKGPMWDKDSIDLLGNETRPILDKPAWCLVWLPCCTTMWKIYSVKAFSTCEP